MIIIGLFRTANKNKENALKPEDHSKNLYALIFIKISEVKKSIKREVIEPNMYIKLTFFSPEKIERKLELI